MKLSKFTLLFSLYVIASSVFMLQVWNAWRAAFGIRMVMLFFIVVSLLAGIGIIYRNTRNGWDIKRIFLISALCTWGFVFALRQPYLSEKAHVLEFGVLGWLAIKDFSRQDKNLTKRLLAALLFCMIIGFLGEGIQKIIPWRIFEIRDIVTNVIGGAFGVALYLVSEPKNRR